MADRADAGRGRILMVDDDADFFELVRLAFARVDPGVQIDHVLDGGRCLDFLQRRPPYAQAPSPDIIMLDLDMPGMGGRETLERIVADETLRHLPVVIFTSHDGYSEVMRMYRTRCNAYLSKPFGMAACVDMARKFCDFWFSAALLPSRTRVIR